MNAADWKVIDDRQLRGWEFFDEHGRWFGRDQAVDVDDAADMARRWLEADAIYQMRDPYEARVLVVCPTTAERAVCRFEVRP